MGQNPRASCGTSHCFHFLPDFSFIALPELFFLESLFHSLRICSIRTPVFCSPSLRFHRQLKYPLTCTHDVPQEAVSLLKCRSPSSQRQVCPPTGLGLGFFRALFLHMEAWSGPCVPQQCLSHPFPSVFPSLPSMHFHGDSATQSPICWKKA